MLSDEGKPSSDFTTVDFPSLMEAAIAIDARSRTRYVGHLDEKVTALAAGVEAGEIRNAEYAHCKHVLSSLIYEAWRVVRTSIYANEGNWTEETSKFYAKLYLSSVNDVRSLGNKLPKLADSGASKATLQKFYEELRPLVDAVDYLKGKVVKGRAPSTKPSVPENPNKDVKTCSCCFRRIAVRGGKMVHHGFERPGDGRQTDSCYGIDHPPLEISVSGLEWLIGVTEKRLEGLEQSLKELPESVQFLHPGRNAPFALTVFKPDHCDWEWARDAKKLELKSRIFVTSGSLESFRCRLTEWNEWHRKQASSTDRTSNDIEDEGLGK